MVTNAQLINRTLGQAVIYLNQKALSVGVTSPDLSVIIFFLRVDYIYIFLTISFLLSVNTIHPPLRSSI